MRTQAQIEKSIENLDLDYELYRASTHRWRTDSRSVYRVETDPHRASFLTGTNVELIYFNTASGTAKNTFTSEVLINDEAGMGMQANLPAGFFAPGRVGQALRFVARGIASSTGTPTYTFTLRGGTQANTSAAIMLGSAAITTASGISNKGWEFEGDVVLRTNSTHGANSTIQGGGMIAGPASFASPFQYELWGGAAQPGTATTFDVSIQNFINFNVTCSASSGSNGVTLLQLLIFGLN